VPFDDSVGPEGEFSSCSPCLGLAYSRGVAALGDPRGVTSGSCNGGASSGLDALLV
jgi:hypothetical protein